MLRMPAARALLLCPLLLLGASIGAASAAPKLGNFEQEAPRSQEELARERSRSNLTPYGGDNPGEVRPFPWKVALLLGGVLVAATPFAIGAFRRTAAELKRRNPGRGS
jgi:hypothetical protein